MPDIEQKYEVERTESGYVIDVWGLEKGMEWYYIKKFTGKGMKPVTLGTVRASGKGVPNRPTWVNDKNSPVTCNLTTLADGRLVVTNGSNSPIGIIRPKVSVKAPDPQVVANNDAKTDDAKTDMDRALDLMALCWAKVNARAEFKDLPSEDRRAMAISLFIEMKRSL